MTSSRQLAAILFTDIAGYTAMMQEDETKAVAVVRHYTSALRGIVAEHHGTIVNDYGDGNLCTFTSATEAVRCALELQRRLQSAPVVPLRIGLHIGEVFIEDGKALGDGVNVASRIQSMGVANSILFSTEIHSKISNQSEFKTISLGSFHFKSVSAPMEVFALANESLTVPERGSMEGKIEPVGDSRKKWATVAALTILTIACVFIYQQFLNQPKKSVAVLSFTDMSPDKDMEYLADGLADEIINLLSRVKGLKVIGSTSSFQFKGKGTDLRSIGRTLGVSNILEGSIRRSGDRLKISARLVQAETGENIWSGVFDKTLQDVFELEKEIALVVSGQLRITLKLTTLRETNEKVHLLIKQGDHFAVGPSLFKALSFYHQAIDVDSIDATAWASLAEYYYIAASRMSNRIVFVDSGIFAANNAIRLDPNLAQGYVVKGKLLRAFKYDLRAASKAFSKAAELEPESPSLYKARAQLQLGLSNYPMAIELARRAVEVDPLSDTWLILGFSYASANMLDSALKAYEHAMEVLPQNRWGASYQGIASIQRIRHEYDDALETIKKLPRKAQWQHLAQLYFDKGILSTGNLYLDSLLLEPDLGSAFQIAEVCAYLGRKEEAFRWLDLAYANLDGGFSGLKRSALLVSLHDDLRWDAMLQRMKFPE